MLLTSQGWSCRFQRERRYRLCDCGRICLEAADVQPETFQNEFFCGYLEKQGFVWEGDGDYDLFK